MPGRDGAPVVGGGVAGPHDAARSGAYAGRRRPHRTGGGLIAPEQTHKSACASPGLLFRLQRL